MTPAPLKPSAVVLDTMLAAALFTRSHHPILALYRPLFIGQPIVLSFITVAELRYGAYKAKWGEQRLLDLEARFLRVSAIVMPDNDLVETQARLRTQCQAMGHGLHDKVHEAIDGLPPHPSAMGCLWFPPTRSFEKHRD